MGYSCSLCCAKFDCELKLLLHFQKKHNDEDSEDDSGSDEEEEDFNKLGENYNFSISESEGSNNNDEEEEEDDEKSCNSKLWKEWQQYKANDSPNPSVTASEDEENPEGEQGEDDEESEGEEENEEEEGKELEWLDIEDLEILASTKTTDDDIYLISEPELECDVDNSREMCEEKLEDSKELQNDKSPLDPSSSPKTNPERSHICSICHCGFTSEAHLIRHMTSHSKNYATLTLKQKEKLRKPCVKSGSDDKSFQCDKCQKFYKTMRGLTLHDKRAHPTKAKFCNRCKQCKKSFCNPQSLRYHVELFHLKEVHCELCKKTFVGKSELLVHRKTECLPPHKRPVQCKICLKYLKTSAYLTQHMKRRHPK